HDERPDIAPGPAELGVDLHQLELLVPADQAGLRPVLRLVGPDRGDRGVVPGHRPTQGNDLPLEAAAVVVAPVDRPAVARLELLDGRLGPLVLDLDAVPLPKLLSKLQGFGELVAGLQIEDPDPMLRFNV